MPAAANLAQVPYERILHSDGAAELADVRRKLRLAAIFRTQADDAAEREDSAHGVGLPDARWRRLESTPLIVDGIMYVTEPPSNVTALDARPAKPLWHYVR